MALDWSGMTFKEARPMKRTPGEKLGKLVLWCDGCDGFVEVDQEKYDGHCPVCGSPIFRMRCTRCDNMWFPRDPRVLPGTCPKCKSPYYNRTRVKGERSKRRADAETSAMIEETVEKRRANAEEAPVEVQEAVE